MNRREAMITLAGAATAAEPPSPLADSVTIGGVLIKPTSPPRTIALRRALGVLTAPSIDGQIIHFARNLKKGLYETRATITPGGDYLLRNLCVDADLSEVYAAVFSSIGTSL